MSALSDDSRARTRLRAAWSGVWWAEGGLVAGAVVALWGVLSEFEWCVGSLGCTAEESEIGAAALILFAVAGCLVVAGLIRAAYASGLPLAGAIARGLLGTLVLGAGLWIGATGHDVGSAFPPIVLGVGVAGAVAIAAPCPRAGVARLLAIVVLGGLALVGPLGVLLAFLVLPAIGVADSVACRLVAGVER